MQIEIALKKIKELSDDELNRYAQLCEIEIVNYRVVCKNYNPEKMLRYGTPMLRHLKDQKETFLSELKSRQEKK